MTLSDIKGRRAHTAQHIIETLRPHQALGAAYLITRLLPGIRVTGASCVCAGAHAMAQDRQGRCTSWSGGGYEEEKSCQGAGSGAKEIKDMSHLEPFVSASVLYVDGTECPYLLYRPTRLANLS